MSAVVFIILLAFSLLLFSSSYTDRLGTIVDIEADQTGSAQWRWNDNLLSLSLVVKNPLIGAGLGMNMLALNQERGLDYWNDIHNVYLEYAVDLGLPGLFLFLALLIACVKNAGFVRKQCRRAPSPGEIFYFAGGIELSLVAFSVAAFFYPVAYQFYFFYVGGLAVAVKTIYLNRSLAATPAV
jgi:O-antigen ligase